MGAQCLSCSPCKKDLFEGWFALIIIKNFLRVLNGSFQFHCKEETLNIKLNIYKRFTRSVLKVTGLSEAHNPETIESCLRWTLVFSVYKHQIIICFPAEQRLVV